MSELIPWQYSIKLDNGGIYVVQADTSEELGLMIEELKSKFLNSRTIPELVQPQATTFVPPPATQATASPNVVCPICGSKAYINEGVSKAGKPYKIQKCSKFPEISPAGHSKWLSLK